MHRRGRALARRRRTGGISRDISGRRSATRSRGEASASVETAARVAPTASTEPTALSKGRIVVAALVASATTETAESSPSPALEATLIATLITTLIATLIATAEEASLALGGGCWRGSGGSGSLHGPAHCGGSLRGGGRGGGISRTLCGRAIHWGSRGSAGLRSVASSGETTSTPATAAALPSPARAEARPMGKPAAASAGKAVEPELLLLVWRVSRRWWRARTKGSLHLERSTKHRHRGRRGRRQSARHHGHHLLLAREHLLSVAEAARLGDLVHLLEVLHRLVEWRRRRCRGRGLLGLTRSGWLHDDLSASALGALELPTVVLEAPSLFSKAFIVSLVNSIVVTALLSVVSVVLSVERLPATPLLHVSTARLQRRLQQP